MPFHCPVDADFRFPCTQCTEKFLFKMLQAEHFEQEHGIYDSWLCDQCPEAFADRFAYAKHKVKHLKNHCVDWRTMEFRGGPCGKCGLPCPTAELHQYHQRHDHTNQGAGEHVCYVCGFTNNAVNGISIHFLHEHQEAISGMVTVAEISIVADTATSTNIEKSGVPVCKGCGEEFPTKRALEAHAQYICGSCCRLFCTADGRDEHERTKHKKRHRKANMTSAPAIEAAATAAATATQQSSLALPSLALPSQSSSGKKRKADDHEEPSPNSKKAKVTEAHTRLDGAPPADAALVSNSSTEVSGPSERTDSPGSHSSSKKRKADETAESPSDSSKRARLDGAQPAGAALVGVGNTIVDGPAESNEQAHHVAQAPLVGAQPAYGALVGDVMTEVGRSAETPKPSQDGLQARLDGVQPGYGALVADSHTTVELNAESAQLPASAISLGLTAADFDPATVYQSTRLRSSEYKQVPTEVSDDLLLHANPQLLANGNLLRIAGKYSNKELWEKINEGRPQKVITTVASLESRIRAACRDKAAQDGSSYEDVRQALNEGRKMKTGSGWRAG